MGFAEVEFIAGIIEDFEVEIVVKNIVMNRVLSTVSMDMIGALIGFDLL